MQEIDLTEFGFDGKKFRYEGSIVKKNTGDRLLLLFAETHKERASIAPNVTTTKTLTPTLAANRNHACTNC